jgi:hypothetical protein
LAKPVTACINRRKVYEHEIRAISSTSRGGAQALAAGGWLFVDGKLLLAGHGGHSRYFFGAIWHCYFRRIRAASSTDL